MKENERTLRLRKQFMSLWKKGWTIKQIAEHEDIQLNVCTVYANLQRIADDNGVTRDSLLRQPHSAHLTYDRVCLPVKPVNIDVFQKHVRNALNELDRFCKQIEEE